VPRLCVKILCPESHRPDGQTLPGPCRRPVERAINEADPIGLLAGGAPSDEYASEIGTIIPLLANTHRPDDVTGVLHGEFLRWFGEGTAGLRHAYDDPARQIWVALLEYRKSD